MTGLVSQPNCSCFLFPVSSTESLPMSSPSLDCHRQGNSAHPGGLRWPKRGTFPSHVLRVSRTLSSFPNAPGGSLMTTVCRCCASPPFQLLKDAWLLHMGVSPWTWQQLQVENDDHGAPELWCHPACRVSKILLCTGQGGNMKVS
jgi:hypothetical protein